MFTRRHHRQTPEKRASATFPIGVLLLAICAIFVYLTIGGGLLETDTVVYTPQIADATGHR
ncbi:membrane protein [Sinorhizobium fredii USDA 205]|uniref:Uncharacterized protein n=1 Tax=Rhizobium fredii TaxID=380 RepID=A0A844A6I6_RHIFR|nr:hypothetical protein [Sinorhizobium fredii]ASY72720.1 hypothetical protein SF83666_b60710 [Sinorhizobium fredii CCBAU 83666]KSV86054.1 membrane protein [Sinorhizobium fredii USDA 205]MQX07758.1 hypothetical protein [Sinorhizobium fredii]GEC33984.1 membrane protein [Sinorhizobium fredii]GLS07790.1 membrane protein [Sinorhizobium fredii]